MKRTLPSIFGLLLFMSVLANPIVLPTVDICELSFDETGHWVVELWYDYINEQDYPIDSIFLISRTDTVKLPDYTFEGENGFIVLWQDSLNSEFNINPSGDSITVLSYMYSYEYYDVLVFGESSGAVISSPRLGQSLCRYIGDYVKDKSPTIGEPNDTTGMCGTVKGTVYDLNNEPVANLPFVLEYSLGYQCETDEYGIFTTRVLSKPNTLNHFSYTVDNHLRFMPIEDIAYVMEPDSIVFRDIHMLDSLLTDVDQQSATSFPVKLYPNPLTQHDRLNYEIDLPVKTANCRIEIYTVSGQMVVSQEITQSNGQIDLSGAVGILLVNFRMENQLLSTNRIVVYDE
ncbi:MAG: T9SS type A sorting domain-containing protein [Bacteroidales bacterium]